MYEKLLLCDIELFKNLNGDLGDFVDNLMIMFSSKITLIGTLIVTLAFLYKKISKKELLFAFLGTLLIVLVADQTCNFFKDFYPRLRPMHEPLLEGYIHLVDGMRGALSGTVSAHAANSFGTLIFLSLIINNKYYTIFAIALALLISYSRIYMGYHYMLDVTYGTLLGLISAFAIYALFKKLTVEKK